MPDAPRWFSLHTAAQQLGVHPNTLRRWADEGQIPVLTTPGGHRRFAQADVEQFAEERRRLRVISGLEELWRTQALQRTRAGINTPQADDWLAAFDAADRAEKRELGQRLMRLMAQYLALREGGDHLLEEARAIGRAHAENALGLKMPLTRALQVLFFFRDAMLEAALQLPEAASVRPEANAALVRRINTVLNAVQLALAETYDRA